jgi:hypothetical protein
MEDLKKENKKIKKENKKLKKDNDMLNNENVILKEKLKKYTNPQRNKKYYENHKEEISKANAEYRKNLSKEKIKEYNQIAYKRRKDKEKKK